ncbi:MAG: flippase-like domain-containing protein [Chitinophagaceae bacterium]|nr:flippase-like domain-containing protein [Chitinophagaceae bacterium]
MKVANKNIKIFLNAVLGPVLFLWIVYSVYKQVVHQPDLLLSVQYVKQALFGPLAWKLYLVLFLMLINWMIEARKWQVLMMPLQCMSLSTSIKSVLAGVSLGLCTPNRVGEYGGRMIYIYEEVRLKSVSMSLLGNISQLIITLLLGCAGLFIQKEIIYIACAGYHISYNWFIAFCWMAVAVTILVIIFYFKIGWIVNIIIPMRFINKWLTKMNGLQSVSVTILLRVLALSAVRYIVFVCQYILMLQLMHVDLNITDAFWLITVLYLILAVIPSVTLLELGMRGMIAVLLFEGFSENTLGIYAASAGIWFINLIIPAVAGGLLIPGLKLFNRP